MALSLSRRLRERRAAGENQVMLPGTRQAAEPELASGFLGGTERAAGDAAYYLIQEDLVLDFPPLIGEPQRLERQLQLVKGIGPKTEARLRETGIVWLAELLDHPRFGREAAQVLRAIEARDGAELSRRGASDWDAAALFAPEEFVFLDLETTGLCSTQPLFLIGLVYLQGGKLCLRQFLARTFEEEEGILAAAFDILSQRPVWVSYNGLTFDEPYIKSRFRCYFGESPAPTLHIDLLRHVRCHYGDLLPNCRLTTVETYLLDSYRTDDVPGYMIPELYYQFVMYQEPALLEGILLHNSRDLQSLVRLLGILQRV